eukprot:UN09404
MQALFSDGKPNLIILDEVDGVAGSENSNTIGIITKLVAAGLKETYNFAYAMICMPRRFIH